MNVGVGRGGLLAVHAHPDDETIATGALLATWAAAGESVTVVTCTRGERGEVIDTATHPTGLGALEGDGPALAAHREGELAAALAALGVTDHIFLDDAALGTGRYEDSGMAWVAPGIASSAAGGAFRGTFVGVPIDTAAATLARVIRARRPRVVATYEPGGGYGHPDHVRAHDVTVRAVELAASGGRLGASGDEPWQVTELWSAVVPEDRLRAARRDLAAAPGLRAPGAAHLAPSDPDEAVLPPVATWWPDAAAAAGARHELVEVDVRPVVEQVVAALRAHATQVQAVCAVEPTSGVIGSYALSNDVLAPLLATESYAVIPLGAASGTPGTVGV